MTEARLCTYTHEAQPSRVTLLWSLLWLQELGWEDVLSCHKLPPIEDSIVTTAMKSLRSLFISSSHSFYDALLLRPESTYNLPRITPGHSCPQSGWTCVGVTTQARSLCSKVTQQVKCHLYTKSCREQPGLRLHQKYHFTQVLFLGLP